LKFHDFSDSNTFGAKFGSVTQLNINI